MMVEWKGVEIHLELFFVGFLSDIVYRYLRREGYCYGKWRVAYWLFVFTFVLVAFGRRTC